MWILKIFGAVPFLKNKRTYDLAVSLCIRRCIPSVSVFAPIFRRMKSPRCSSPVPTLEAREDCEVALRPVCPVYHCWAKGRCISSLFSISVRSVSYRRKVQFEYLELTVRRREVEEVLVVAGRAPACWLMCRMQYRRCNFTVQGRMLLCLNLRRLLALKGNEWLTITPLNFQEWTRRTTAQLCLDCQL
jgi:hypothetical protein